MTRYQTLSKASEKLLRKLDIGLSKHLLPSEAQFPRQAMRLLEPHDGEPLEGLVDPGLLLLVGSPRKITDIFMLKMLKII